MNRKIIENLKIFLITVGAFILVGGADSIGEIFFS